MEISDFLTRSKQPEIIAFPGVLPQFNSGDIFIYDNKAYIKLDCCEEYVKAKDTRQDINAVNLENGECVCIAYDDRVIYPNEAQINIDI